MRPGGLQVRSGAFSPFPCSLVVVGCVRSITVRPKGCQVRALGIFGIVRVRLFHSHAPCGGPQVRWCAFGPFPFAIVIGLCMKCKGYTNSIATIAWVIV